MTEAVARSRTRSRPSLFSDLKPLTRLFNGPAARLAGSRALPFWALVRHRGRKSGRTYSTPVAARRTTDGFAIPLAFGETADWARNVLAAGGCVIRWSGREYRLVDPVVVDAAERLDAFGPVERRAFALARIRRILILRDENVLEPRRRQLERRAPA